MTESNLQAGNFIIQKVDKPIHWINLNLVDNAVDIRNTYPLDNDLSGLISAIKHLNKRGQNCNVNVMDKRTSLTVRSSHVKDR